MRSRRPGLVFILISVLLDMLGIGLFVPVLPMPMTQMRGGDSGGCGTVRAIRYLAQAPQRAG